MGKIVNYPEKDITKEIEKDGFKVTIEVYKGDEGDGGGVKLNV